MSSSFSSGRRRRGQTTYPRTLRLMEWGRLSENLIKNFITNSISLFWNQPLKHRQDHLIISTRAGFWPYKKWNVYGEPNNLHKSQFVFIGIAYDAFKVTFSLFVVNFPSVFQLQYFRNSPIYAEEVSAPCRKWKCKKINENWKRLVEIAFHVQCTNAHNRIKLFLQNKRNNPSFTCLSQIIQRKCWLIWYCTAQGNS